MRMAKTASSASRSMPNMRKPSASTIFRWCRGKNLKTFPAAAGQAAGALSYRRMNEFRRIRYLEGKRRNYQFTSFIHPDSHIYTTDIGENCLILEANIVQPYARIGNNVIMWSGNHIGHHCVIGDPLLHHLRRLASPGRRASVKAASWAQGRHYRRPDDRR